MRTYAWGSRTAIADFTGAPSPTLRIPRPSCGSALIRRTRRGCRPTTASSRCSRRLRADPEGELGPVVRGRFGDTLPFLVKVLAADEPLSLQAHPSTEQAIEGFAREERMGIPVSAPNRNYRDRSHKPELMVALSQFEALAGFRPAAHTVELMQALAVADARSVHQPALRPDRRRRLAGAVHDVDHLSRSPISTVLVPAVLDGAINYVRSGEQGIRRRSQGPCSNSASVTRTTRASWPRCCSTG